MSNPQYDNHTGKWTYDDPHVPYRGGVIHLPGQPPPVWTREASPQEMQDVDRGENVEVVETYEDQKRRTKDKPNWKQPVPVTVESLPPRTEYKDAKFTNFFLEDQQQRIVDKNERRYRTYIKYLDDGATEAIYLSSDSNVSHINGYPLMPGDDVEMTSTGDIYAICTTGETGTVGIIQELAYDLD